MSNKGKDLNTHSQFIENKKFKTLRDLQNWLIEDFRNFVQYINMTQNYRTGRIQLHIAEEMTEGHDTLLIMCFRNSSKTYLVDLYILWRLMRYRNTKILILSAKQANASKHMRNISRLIRTVPALSFMSFKRSKMSLDNGAKKTMTGFHLSGASQENDLSVTMEGIFAAIEGSRADLIILDDTEVKSNSDTPAARQKLLDRFSEVQAILHEPGRHCKNKENIPLPERTQSIYIGTPQSEFSVYFPQDEENHDNEEAEPHPLNGAHVIKIPAINENGKSNFPEKWTRQQLEIKKSKMSKPAWALQMLLDPSAYDKEARVIDIDNIVKWSGNTTQTIMTCDPRGESAAGGTDEGAYCVAGLAQGFKVTDKINKNIVHIRALGGWKNISANDYVKNCLEIAKANRVEKIIVESNFSAYATLFQNKIFEMGSFAQIVPIKSSMRKQDRLIETLDPNINAGRICFEPKILEDKVTINQLKEWTYSSLPTIDDRLDCLSFAVQYFMDSLKHSNEWKWESATRP